ncbi:MAG TPA: TolC family protein [Bryobacteraceae bacterium]|nr:TolC family protein [Bryobacteraceae bacterium]
MLPLRVAISLVFAAAAYSLSFQEALDEGLAAHSLLQAADAKIRGAEGLRTQASLKPNPRLFLQSENSRVWSNPSFVYARDADSFFYASQVVETGGKRTRRTEAAQAGVQRTAAERDALRWQIAARIGAAYWTAAGAARYRDAFQENLKNFDRTVQYHQDRVKEGAMAEVDFLRVQLEAERMRAAYRTAQQEAVTARIRLFREMGIPDRPDTTFGDRLEQTTDVNAPLDIVKDRPDVAAARAVSLATAANVQLQIANARPDPEILGGYKRTNGYDTLIAGVQINLPFRNRNQGNIAAAEADVTAAGALERATLRTARAEAEAALATYENRRTLVTVTLPAVRDRAVEIARISNAAYREGGTDLLRLLDAERSRIDADLLYYRALTEFQIAAVELRSALGLLR